MKFTGIAVCILALISKLVHGNAIAQNNWSAEDREIFTRRATQTCFETQRAAPENASNPDGVLIAYCRCTAAHVAENSEPCARCGHAS